MKKIALTLLILFLSGMIIHAEDSTQSPQQFQGFNLAGYGDGGKKTWDVKGDTADIIDNIVKLTNIVANAYGAEQTNLTARNGTLDKATGKMHLENDVVITTDSGARMTTDSLDWDKTKDLVKTNDKVVITKEGMTATGTGALGHPSLKEAQLNDDVTVKIDTKKPDDPNGGVVTITCDGPMEMEYDHEKAIFNKNVVAFEGDRKLIADKMEVFFDTGNKQVKEMICTGHVSIIQGQNTTYSEKAVYTAADKKLVLLGRPKLILYTQNKTPVLPLGPPKVEPKTETPKQEVVDPHQDVVPTLRSTDSTTEPPKP